MSNTISFKRIAFQLNENNYRNKYICIEQIGNDRTYDFDGKISRRWGIVAIGRESECIADIASRTTREIETGMLKYQNGTTKTENYISNWRDSIKDSESLDTLLNSFKVLQRNDDGDYKELSKSEIKELDNDDFGTVKIEK